MFQNLLKGMVTGAIRHLLTGIGGSLVADGLLSQGDANQAIGSILFLIGAGWSMYEKYKTHQDADLTGATVQTVPVSKSALPPIK